MPISGPVLHRQLLAAYAAAQTRLESERGQITAAQAERQSLGTDRGDVLVSLAQHYLPELSREAIQSTWSDVQRDMTAVLQRKEDHERRVDSDIHRRDDQRIVADQALIQINEQLDTAIEQQESVAAQIESQLQSDPEFAQLSDRAAVAEVAVERAEANLREIEQDSARKLPEFDHSSLFRYLHDRGFGSEKYEHRGFTRRMDRILAKFVNYNQANQSYTFLRDTPVQMRQIIAEDRTALETVLDELELRRDRVAETMGLPRIISTVGELTKSRDAALQQVDAIRTELQSLQAQLTQLSDKRGPYHAEATKVFRAMLERIDPRDLERHAASTQEITDDQIVARLQSIDASIDGLDDAARSRRSTLNAMQSSLEGLGRMIQQFRLAEFDSERAQFIGSFDLNDELSQVRDASDLDDVWVRVKRAQRWGPSTMDHIVKVAQHPMTQILVNAMAHAAAGALSGYARNAGSRRNSGSGRSGGGGQPSRGGFENRDWF